MLLLQTSSYLFTLPKTLKYPSSSSSFSSQTFHLRRHPPPFLRRNNLTAKSFSSEEFPIDESFEENFGPNDKESEEEARRRNWIERGWAPWEEILTPEADFARKSLNEGEEVPLKTPEAIEAFKMLSPKYREKKRQEMGLTEEEYYRKQYEIKGEIPEPLQTGWVGPVVFRMIPPRDWPPRGWEVDRTELAYIREAHKLLAKRVKLEDLENCIVGTETNDMCLDRYKMFLKQYSEWVEANKDRLEEESYKQDQDYYAGRRIRGKDYKEGMYELPFYYPGQVCRGEVKMVHLYQGAFIDIGGVHDGWVPIKNNDWFWIRHHVKVGMPVMVEITAKRDPYRFRFPIELRLLEPNIDHLIFNRFDFPPIFHRDEDTNEDELRRDCGRPPVPRRDPKDKPEDAPLLSNHPYVDKLWQINVAEQLILTDIEVNPDKYKGKKLSELTDDEEFDEKNAVQKTQVYYKDSLVDKTILKTSVKELDLEAAFAEHQAHKKLWKEAKDRGEEFKPDKLRRNIEMDEYDYMHWRRSFEEREALLRDISCRKTLGLPLEEPGRYVDASYFGDEYDPTNPLYRYDYWGEPKNSEKSQQERMTERHNKSIVGNGTVWYEMSYEDCIKQQMLRKARDEAEKAKQDKDEDAKQDHGTEEEDEYDDDDFDFSLLSNIGSNSSEQLHVNGTEASIITDAGIFED